MWEGLGGDVGVRRGLGATTALERGDVGVRGSVGCGRGLWGDAGVQEGA